MYATHFPSGEMAGRPALPVKVSCRVTIGLAGGAGRKIHARVAMTPSTAVPPSRAAIRRLRERFGGRAGRLSAAANSPTLAKRSAGVRARARVTAISTPAGTARSVVSFGSGSLNRLAMIACAVGPVYGGSPASISYTTHARLYWSLRPSKRVLPVACSGLM